MAEIRNLTRNGETFYPLTTSSAVINEATGEGLVIDETPTAGSDNLVKSSGVYDMVNQLEQEVYKLDKAFTKVVPQSELTYLGDYYLNRQDGRVISEYSACKLYYYPVTAGKFYYLVSELDWYDVYDAVGFSTNIPVSGGNYDLSLINADIPSNKCFVPEENGYILLGYYSTMKSFIYEFDDNINIFDINSDVDKLKIDLLNLNNKVENIEERLVEYQEVPVSELVSLGGAYMDSSGHSIISTQYSNLYYYPVVAGTKYKLSSEINWFGQYPSIAFATELPVVDSSHWKSALLYCDTQDTFYYTPTENGYILLLEHTQRSKIFTPSKIDIEALKKDVEQLQQDIKNLQEKFIEYNEVLISGLTDLGGAYMQPDTNHTITSTQYAKLYYYPVTAGVKYKVSSEINWYGQYPAIGFATELPVVDSSHWKSALLYCDTQDTFYYTPTENGYILLLENSGVRAKVFIPNEINLETLKKTTEQDIAELQQDVEALEDNFNNYEVVSKADLSYLGNYYLDRQGGRNIMPYATCKLYYYPVTAGTTYRLSSEFDWYAVYDAIGFSVNVPVANGTYDQSIVAGNPPVEETFFTPSQNGYILLGQAYDMKSYVYIQNGTISLLNLKNNVSNIQNEVDELKVSSGDAEFPLKKNIICSGSSITWGSGPLDSSMVAYVDRFLKEKLADLIMSNDNRVTYSSSPTSISNSLLYNATGRKIEGVGSTIEFDLYGDEISICQASRRIASDYGVMKVFADGIEIGVFDNKNTILSDSETFTGSGIREVKLKHPCTFNHRIYINGSSTPLENIAYNMVYDGVMPDNCDAWIFRGSTGDGSETCHYIQFAASLGTITSVYVEYDYGRIIAHERSTVGQTADEYINESYYGKGSVSYDPAHPSSGISSGLEFRAIDNRAFFVHKFDSYKYRHFKIEIIGGTNPYFIFNFATSRYHNLMNAGIGGWQLFDLMYLSDKLCNWTQFFKYWHPDILFEEAMTNDDWEFATRRISRSIGEVTLEQLRLMHQLEVHKITYNSNTDKYVVEMCTGIISSITSTSLVSNDIIGTQTQVGDIIRIGNYHSDMHQIVCRKITEVNLTTGEVKWIEPLVADDILMIDSLEELVGAEINIRNLDTYKNYYEDLISKVHSVSPNTKIVIVHNGLPNLYTRQLWGYEIVHAELCQENENVAFINAQDHIYDTMFNNITGVNKETVVSTGASSYDLQFAGTSYGGWQGFQVLVNGVNVYGKDAYIEMDMAYRVKTQYSGSTLNKTSPYDRSHCDWVRTGAALTLHFIKNAPTAQDTIEVRYTDTIWSDDFCHTTDFGARVYAESYCNIINRL